MKLSHSQAQGSTNLSQMVHSYHLTFFMVLWWCYSLKSIMFVPIINQLNITIMSKLEKALNWIATAVAAALALLPYLRDIIAHKPF
jgi:hypothetical protein